MKVTDRHGRTWRIRRHWIRRDGSRGPGVRWRERRRRRKRDGGDGNWFDALDLFDLAGDSPLGAIVALIGAVVLIVVLAVWGIPFLIALFDLLLLLIVSIAGVIGRIVFRRPWTVEAVANTGDRRELKVVGWRNSAQAKRSLADEVGRPEPFS